MVQMKCVVGPTLRLFRVGGWGARLTRLGAHAEIGFLELENEGEEEV